MSQGLQYFTSFAATTSGGVVTFTEPGTSSTMIATYVRIENTGTSSPAYIKIGSTTATSSDYPLVTGSSNTLVLTAVRGRGWDSFAYVSTSAAAPTVRVLALR